MSEKVVTPCSTTPALPSTTMTAVPVALSSTPSLTTISASVASPHTTSAGLVTATSVTSHPTMHSVQQTIAHPSVPPSPIPQVQVIQQPLHSPTYLPHMYSPQQQLLMPSNLGLSPQIQVIAAASKPCVPNQLTTQMLAGKQMLQGQSNYIPSTTNQTLVIGQLGVLPSQSSMIPTHTKQVADSQKVRPYVMSPAGTLQSKSPILPHPQTHTAVTVAGTQVLNSSQFKQLTSQATLVSTPQLITSQAPAAMIASQSQIINGLQAISTSLPPGLSWATHGGLQSHVITAQNPIFIRSSQQQDMFIQSQPATPAPIQPQPNMGQLLQQQHHNPKPKHTLELAPHIQPKIQTTSVGTKTLTSILPSTVAPIRPASSVATQTNAMTHGAHFHPRPQIKQRLKPHVNRTVPGPGGVHLQHKADAANQTKIILASQHNPSTIQMKIHAENKVNSVKAPPPNAVVVPAVTTDVSTNLNLVSIPPVLNPQLSATVEEAMETEPTTMVTAKDTQSTVSSKPIAISNASASETIVCQQQQLQEPDEGRSGTISIPLGSSGRPPGPAHKMRILGNLTNEEPASTTVPVQHTNGVQTVPAVAVVPHESPVPSLPLGLENAKEKQPQKAIVKPHVLTHVIEGYIIQEAPEPFPVNRSSMNTEFVAPKPSMPVKETAEETRVAEAVEIAVTPPCPPQSTVTQGIQSDNWSNRDKREAKCEFCGKVDGKSRFKRSKRFCSTSCAKRYNVGCTKRLGLFAPPETESGKYAKKKKHGLKIKKGLRKIQSGRLSYNAEEWNVVESPGKEDETNSSNSGAESSLSPITPPSQKDMMDLDITDAESRKNPQKWSVQDVFDFIKELPGCTDYADEFRLQEIDGQALMLLKEDHLMTAMNMKLGPALKICAKINSLKEELQRQ